MNIQETVFDGYELSRKHRKQIDRRIASGLGIHAFVLTCPAYTSSDDVYTFNELGGGVPMMAAQHLEAIDNLCRAGLVEKIAVLMADVEAYNAALVDKYTDGDAEEYLSRLHASTASIEDKYGDYYRGMGIEFCSSSFLTAFEPEVFGSFMELREEIKRQILQKYNEVQSVKHRIHANILQRSSDGYYRREYGEYSLKPIDVLIDREATTMAEYVSLGYLIGSTAVNPLIVVHSSDNTHLLNSSNDFSLELPKGGLPGNPLLIRQRKVY